MQALLQGPRQLQTLDEITLASNAGPYQENSLLGVPSEVDTGESFGSGTKVNVCKFQLGDVNNWIVSRLYSHPRSHRRATTHAQ